MALVNPRRSGGDRVQYVTPDEKSSLLSQLGQRSGQAIEALGLLLDTPGAIARGVLSGDPLSGFSFDRDTRVTGEELLDSYGLKPENPYLSTPAGFIAEVALDPLAYATFGLSSGNTAARAASKAGLMKYVPYAASQKAGAEATRTGKYTLDAIKKAGLKPTTSVLQTRPLLGPRLAGMATTLDEAVKAAPDAGDALLKVQNALGDIPYADVANERVGGLFGFTNPFTGKGWSYNPNMYAGATSDISNLNLAEKAADALDRVGQGLAWSYPARLASAAFDKAVGGRIGVADQITVMRRSNRERDALARARGEATEHALRLDQLEIPDATRARTGIDGFFSPAGGDALVRLVEGKPAGADLDLLREVPGLDNWIVRWHQIAESQLASAKALGLKSSRLQDPFGLMFSPRSAPEIDFSDMASGGPLRAALYSANINSQIARNRNLKVPGGTDQLKQLFLDPRVAAWRKGLTQETEQDIGGHIAQLINHPLVDQKQGEGIARVFRRAAKDLPDDMPIFGTHPLVEQMGYIVGEGIRQANAESMFEALSDAVVLANGVPLRANAVPGGKHVSLLRALGEIGQEIGLAFPKNAAGKRTISRQAADQVRQMVAATHFAPGTNPRNIRLAQLAVPTEVVNRLKGINQFYASPDVQKEVSGMFDKFTTLFKASVLAWPSRFTRDFYSNAFSLWLENGSASETIKGIWAGSKLINDEYDAILPYLRQIPRYKSITGDDALINQLKLDIGRTGILSGLASADLMSASRRGDVAQFIPGSTPISVSRALSELKPQAGVSMAQRAQDFFTIRGVTTNQDTKNAFFNASNMLGDTIDSMGRIGGFLSLMRQGVAPEEAASRMMKALVDYSSLTPFERNTIRNKIFPWWAYTSRIGKYAVESLLNNPGGRYGQTIRAINDLQATTDKTYIPTALRQRFAIRMPQIPGITQTDAGGNTYLTDIDLPGIDVLNLVKLGYQPDVLGSLLQSIKFTAMDTAQQANPLLRTVMELATDTDFYSKRPLSQANTAWDKIYSAAIGERYARLNPITRAAVSNIPLPLLQRSANALGALVDPRIPSLPVRAGKAFVNNTTGVKITTVDPEMEDLDAMGKIAQTNEPYNREFTVATIPKEYLPRVPLENQRLNALNLELQRDLRKTYERKYGRKKKNAKP